MIRHPAARAAPLAILLFWAPLPFASAGATARTGLALAAFLTLALALWSEPVTPRALPAALVAAALAALALWGFVQSSSWPAGLASTLSPSHALLARASSQSLGLATPERIRLSVAPSASRSAALDWGTAAAVLLSAALVGSSRRARRVLAGTLLGAALFQLFFGAQRWIARSNTLWGVELPDLGARLRGTFVNPNHAALYFELALALAFAWSWWGLRRAARTGSVEERLLRSVLPTLAWFLLFVGLAFTRSRAGLLAALLAVALQGAGIGSRAGRRWLAASGLVAALAGISLVSYLGHQEGLGRLLGAGGDRLHAGDRIEVARSTLELWRRFPLTGSGLGSFRDAFPMVRSPGTPGDYHHAHSEAVELAATVGLVGLALALAALVILALRLRRVLRFGERSEDRAAALAALGGLASALIHGVADFGLTLPANAVALAVLVGAASAARTARITEEAPEHEHAA